MFKKLIILLVIAVPLSAQNPISELMIDSLTYNQYLTGNWSQLIETGKIAKNNNVNFMYLQQRLGYANYMLGNDYKTIEHYQNALKFTKDNQVSYTYLYYAAKNIADEDMALFYASKLNSENKKALQIKGFRPIDAIDIEYNYKINSSDIRSNPNYTRLGLNIQPTYRLSLYQSISRYNQTNNSSTKVQQDEYFGLMTYRIFSRTSLNFGYHYIHTKLNDATYSYTDTIRNHIFIGKLEQRINRFDIGISSYFNTGDTLQTQMGAWVGIHLAGSCKPYIKSSLYSVNRSGENRLIYSQNAGILVSKELWLDSEIIFGNLDKYIDNNGLYVYNSLDPTTFRAGTTLFWYLIPKLTFFTNYTFDKKNIISTNSNYNQHSISGGIIWKL